MPLQSVRKPKGEGVPQTLEGLTGTVPPFAEQCASALWDSVALNWQFFWFVISLFRFDALCPIQMQVSDDPGNFLKRTIMMTGVL